MIIYRETLKYKTKKKLEFIDLTNKVKEVVKKSKVKEGQVLIYSPHTTCAIKINEKETCFIADFCEFIESLAPADKYYRHDDLKIRTENLSCSVNPGESECINGHSHIKQMLVGSASECVPISKGKMLLGRWQWIMMVELDQSRSRDVIVQVIGE